LAKIRNPVTMTTLSRTCPLSMITRACECCTPCLRETRTSAPAACPRPAGGGPVKCRRKSRRKGRNPDECRDAGEKAGMPEWQRHLPNQGPDCQLRLPLVCSVPWYLYCACPCCTNTKAVGRQSRWSTSRTATRDGIRPEDWAQPAAPALPGRR
jgi:hypothetical protein